MSESKRCPCGARIMSNHVIEMDGKVDNIYTCGVCGSQVEVVQEADSTRY